MSNGGGEVSGDHSSGEASSDECESNPFNSINLDDPTCQYGIYFLQQASMRLPRETYRAFLNLLIDYRHQAKTVEQVVHEGNALLAGYPDLIAIFKDFCPNP